MRNLLIFLLKILCTWWSTSFLLLSRFSAFDFWKSKYSVSWCGSLWVHLTFNLLSFLDVHTHILHYTGEVFSHYFFKFFFLSLLPLFYVYWSVWWYSTGPLVSLHFSSIFFSISSSDLIISIFPCSNLLILSSACLNMPLNSSSELLSYCIFSSRISFCFLFISLFDISTLIIHHFLDFHHIFLEFKLCLVAVAVVVQSTQSCLTLCDPTDCSTPVFPALHYLLEFAQTHIHWVGDAIQLILCCSLLPSRPAFQSFSRTVFVDIFSLLNRLYFSFLCMPCHVFVENWVFKSNNVVALEIRFSLLLRFCWGLLLFSLLGFPLLLLAIFLPMISLWWNLRSSQNQGPSEPMSFPKHVWSLSNFLCICSCLWMS